MATSRRTDYLLLSYFVGLLLFGLVMLTSASSPIGFDRFDDRFFFIKRQILFGVLPGLVAFIALAKIHYGVWQKYAMHIFVLANALLLLVFIPGVGSSLNTTANSWIVIGGNSVQPAEFAKLGLIIFMAALLARMGKGIEDPKTGFLTALGMGMIPIVLIILQPDIGTVAILFAVLFAMLFVARAKISHIIALAGAGIAGMGLMIAVAPYRAARFTTFLHPELDPQGVGYHINQAFLAIGSGGFFGLGLGHSRQKIQNLPEVHAHSIYAVIEQ